MDLKISDVSRELRVDYMRLLRVITSGKVPARRNPSGTRWLVNKDDLPEIAAVLGVKPPGRTEATQGSGR